MKISRDLFLSPLVLFILYMAVSCLGIIGFRLLVPGVPPPLPIYARQWGFIQGFLTFIGLYPALIMAGLIIPFGFRYESRKDFSRFSAEFLDYIRVSIVIAISAVTVYGLLFFLAFPLTHDYETYLTAQGRLFKSSKEKAEINAEKGSWPEVSQCIAICEQIWPESPETESLRLKFFMGMDDWRLAQANAQLGVWVEDEDYTDIILTYSGIGGQQKPVNAAEALALADKAMRSERYFDAHWLANLGSRLAPRGSAEQIQGNRLASQAWNAVGSLEPNVRELKLYSQYQLKQAGYEAMIGEDWIRAYYIFRDLSVQTPGDPDVERFLAISQRGASDIAFFTDEIELTLGEILTDALFSLPLEAPAGKKNGRIVLRFDSLSTFGGFSYGAGIDLMTFDGEGNLLYRVETPYSKIVPVTLDSGSHIILMLRALDRLDKDKNYEPVWSGPDKTLVKDTYLKLDITYEDFLVLSKLRQGLDLLFVGDILTMAKRIGYYGYIPQLFQAEILYRISEVAIFLPLTILAVIVGWRYRTQKRNPRLGIPMLFLLPLIFNGLVFLSRTMLNTLSIWSVISLGFSGAILLFSIGTIVFFVFSLILLAAQHG